MLKYAVYPGTVISKNDGQKHYISAQKLIQLYGANPSECVIVHDIRDARRLGAGNLLSLRPLYHGNYREIFAALDDTCECSPDV